MKKMLLAALVFLAGFQVEASVAKQNRALVLVSELDTHGAEDLADMYRALENATRSIAPTFLRDDYGIIVNLNDNMATAANFVVTLRNLAARSDIQAIDVILSLHGKTDKVWFKEGRVRVSTLKDNLLTTRNHNEEILVNTMKRKLRLMYNLSCYGESATDEFIDMGFDTAIGSKKVNANAEVEFPSVLGSWQFGARIDQALLPTNNDAAIAAHDGPLRLAGQVSGREMLIEVDSQKIIAGSKSLTINSDPR